MIPHSKVSIHIPHNPVINEQNITIIYTSKVRSKDYQHRQFISGISGGIANTLLLVFLSLIMIIRRIQ